MAMPMDYVLNLADLCIKRDALIAKRDQYRLENHNKKAFFYEDAAEQISEKIRKIESDWGGLK